MLVIVWIPREEEGFRIFNVTAAVKRRFTAPTRVHPCAVFCECGFWESGTIDWQAVLTTKVIRALVLDSQGQSPYDAYYR
jgi:hypothetical protein